MNGERKKLVVLALALVVIVVAVVVMLGRGGGGGGKTQTVASAGGQDQSHDWSVLDSDPEYLETVAEIAKTRAEHTYTADPERDPMAALVLESDARASRPEREEAPAPVVLPPMTLGGIIWDDETPIAMIDGQDVRPGDTVKGARVKSIGHESVELVYKGERFVLRLR